MDILTATMQAQIYLFLSGAWFLACAGVALLAFAWRQIFAKVTKTQNPQSTA